MDNLDYTTSRKKGAHLTQYERGIIFALHKQGKSNRFIAAELNCSPSTIGYEIKRGTPARNGSRGRLPSYNAKYSQKCYEQNRKRSVRKRVLEACQEFCKWLKKKFTDEDYSLDACVGEARLNKLFDYVPCTRTLYAEVHRGNLLSILSLPEAAKRKPYVKTKEKNTISTMGTSIEKRPDIIATKEEFGHWEIDTVVGTRSGSGEVALTLLEKKTRKYIALKIAGKTKDAVYAGLEYLRNEYGSKFTTVFKSITSDNGKEFARLNEIEAWGTTVYFAHPYASCERGQNERHNRLLRRYIPKGRTFESYSEEEFLAFVDKINNLPRRVLGYLTPESLFDEQLDVIYAIV